MNNLDNYLPKDAGKAASELRCLYDLKRKQELAIAQGNFMKAKILGADILNSLNELEFLQDRKQNHDRLRKVVIQMEDQGIMAAIVQVTNE